MCLIGILVNALTIFVVDGFLNRVIAVHQEIYSEQSATLVRLCSDSQNRVQDTVSAKI